MTSTPKAPSSARHNHQNINLACPHCGQMLLQLSIDARPIQEQKVACPACARRSKMAALKTSTGDTYQLYIRQIDPRAQISVYSYKK
ncbi:transcription elongation factor Elf1 [Herbaspirillum sp. Sphag1AN]|uniref:hypothetical protein n=1 Tax=unclassified Herbaspirillum TaxID=2624150 RepID=UPI0016178943|nr:MULTISPECIES: hypothetical protein [unclassified Herbaspirillum]MBB3213543.1 transcription elongation factor Elf1 [Herbaspirillum sp. Sphag1AN]MBB3246741.1 transcription elongation factor Elf1 [Herbaspirillum sp. Sphag64]